MANRTKEHAPRHPRSLPPQGPVRASAGKDAGSGISHGDISAVEPGDTVLAAPPARPARRKRNDPEMAALDPELREELESALYGDGQSRYEQGDRESEDASEAKSPDDMPRDSTEPSPPDDAPDERGAATDSEEPDDDQAAAPADSGTDSTPVQSRSPRKTRPRSPVRAVDSLPVQASDPGTASAPEPPDFLSCYPLPPHESPRDREICMILAGLYVGRGGLTNHYT